MALPIVPERLREMRGRRGLPMHTLAERAGLSKDTLWRIENGSQPGNREDTQRRLARTLGVEPGVLTGARPLPEPDRRPRRRWTVEVTEATRNAAILAARRYGVSEGLIVELAPLLFVLAAEASLGRRRAALATLETALEKAREAGAGMPHLAGVGEATEAVRAAVAAEERSVAKREIFAADIDAGVLGALGEAGGAPGADNPLAKYLGDEAHRASVAAPGLAEVASVTGDRVDAALCREEASELGGGDARVMAAIIAGEVSLAEMPQALWSDGQARLAWLRDQIK